MSKKLTKKERFVRILQRDKYYRGDKKYTVRLYRRFLHILKDCNKCNSTMLFECNTVRNKKFFINRGYSEIEATNAIQKIQSRGYNNRPANKIKESNAKRKQTLSNKSENEKNRINKLKGSGYTPEYVSRKYNITINEAKKRIEDRKARKVKSYKLHLNTIGGYRKEWSSRCIDFWIKRGYSEEEAKELIKSRSDTRSVDSIVSRLGVSLTKAKEIQREVSEKCRETFNSKTEQEKREILLKRTRHFKSYSRASVRFFECLMNELRHLDLTWLYGENEYFLWDKRDKENKIYFYDLTLPEINIIIEYNGIIFHPRKHDTWATTVEESIAKDSIKEKLARDHNFKIYYVWDDEDISLALEKIKSIIKQEYEHRADKERITTLL